MKKMKLVIVACLLLGLLSFLSPSVLLADASQCDAVVGNLVKNCGFETGDFTDWTTILAASGSHLVVKSLFPRSGADSAGFGAFGDINDSIEQSFATTPGTLYTFSFWADLSNGGPSPTGKNSEFSAFWNGTQVFDQVGIVPGDYIDYVFSEMATASSTTIEFSAQNQPSAYLLDDISVTPTPEPSSWLLLGTGLLGFVPFLRRRIGIS